MGKPHVYAIYVVIEWLAQDTLHWNFCISCRLFSRVERMEMDLKLEKVSQYCQVFKCLEEIAKNIMVF